MPWEGKSAKRRKDRDVLRFVLKSPRNRTIFLKSCLWSSVGHFCAQPGNQRGGDMWLCQGRIPKGPLGWESHMALALLLGETRVSAQDAKPRLHYNMAILCTARRRTLKANINFLKIHKEWIPKGRVDYLESGWSWEWIDEFGLKHCFCIGLFCKNLYKVHVLAHGSIKWWKKRGMQGGG